MPGRGRVEQASQPARSEDEPPELPRLAALRCVGAIKRASYSVGWHSKGLGLVRMYSGLRHLARFPQEWNFLVTRLNWGLRANVWRRVTNPALADDTT